MAYYRMMARKTIQKTMIQQELSRSNIPITAEALFYGLRKKIPALDLSTVYRNLNLMASKGEIAKVGINREFYFDANPCGKVYLVCTKCGDIAVKKINIANHIKSKDFKIKCMQTILHGHCRYCKEEE